jgi:methylphosphotriester-DNA--protein-cysteine methyltransferase
MHPKDLAARHGVKVFDTREAAEKEGFRLGERRETRNVWNRDSNASATLFDLIGRRARGEAEEVALVLDIYGVSGAIKKGSEVAGQEPD